MQFWVSQTRHSLYHSCTLRSCPRISSTGLGLGEKVCRVNELIHCCMTRTEFALFLLNTKFNNQSVPPFQHPGINFPREAEDCDTPIIGAHPPVSRVQPLSGSLVPELPLCVEVSPTLSSLVPLYLLHQLHVPLSLPCFRQQPDMQCTLPHFSPLRIVSPQGGGLK